MNQQISMSDFFGMEASDYLEKLDRLVTGSSRPETTDLVRLARALRGSAMMASQRNIADAAGALEAFARALHDTRVDWDAGNKQLVTRVVDDLKVLVRKLDDRTPEEEASIASLSAELTELAGRETPPERARTSGLDTGTRAFIGREGSAVASALQRASQTAASGHVPREVSDSILQAIQPLRGIASLNDVPPLPDLLDGVDRIATECHRRPDRAIDGLKGVLGAAAEAIARVAREVAATGTPDPASPEAARFARLMRTAFEGEGAVIAIEDLFFDDDGPHIVQRGTGPDTQLSGVELVSHGEHLRQAADQLDAAASETQRDLRLQSLEARLVTLATLQGEGIAAAVSGLARRLQAIITGIGPGGDVSILTAHLRAGAGILATAATESEETLAAALRNATAEMVDSAVGEAPQVDGDEVAAEVTPEPQEEVELMAAGVGDAAHAEEAEATPSTATQTDAGPDRDLATVDGAVAASRTEDDDEVSGEQAEEPQETVIPDVDRGTDLAACYATYEAMLATLGTGTPSLEDLLAGPPVAAESAIGEVAPPVEATDELPLLEVEPLPDEDRMEPEVLLAAAGTEDTGDIPSIEDFVLPDDDLAPIEQFLAPVTDFCYDGREALQQALALKSSLREILDSDQPERAAELIVEVLDLIELGLGSDG